MGYTSPEEKTVESGNTNKYKFFLLVFEIDNMSTAIAQAIGAVDDLIAQLERGSLQGCGQVAGTSAANKSAASAAKKRQGKDKKRQGKVEKTHKAVMSEKPKNEAKEAPAGGDPTVDLLDIRVGLIKSIGPHPDADSLYVESIDLGEKEPRTVVSGLRKFVSEEAMANRLVAVVCNLKPAKMRGILSTGMVLCASNDDHTAVDPILIPEGSSVGSRILVEGYDQPPMEQINPKKKIFERIAPDMVVSSDGECEYKGKKFTTDKGVVTATIPGAHIA